MAGAVEQAKQRVEEHLGLRLEPLTHPGNDWAYEVLTPTGVILGKVVLAEAGNCVHCVAGDDCLTYAVNGALI